MIDDGTRLTLLPRTTALFIASAGSALMSATRFASGGGHGFLMFVMPTVSVERIFGPIGPLMKRNLGIIRRWTDFEIGLSSELLDPPVQSGGEKAWFLAKTLEVLSIHFFRRPENNPGFFCTMVKASAHRYVREALALLQSRIDQPLDLTRLARDVGCASHYLSRLVKQESGKTLSLHLRAFRAEKAAELLSGNRFNVTEVALEVGYQSLSHFSKAFAQEKGMSPSQFAKRLL